MRSTSLALLAATILLSGCITTDRERHRKRIAAADVRAAMPAALHGATIARAEHW